MSCPRIDVDLRKIRHNTRAIADQLMGQGIRVTAVTKAVCGHPAIARAMLAGGATGLAEARLSNVKRLRQSGMTCPVTLIRTPMPSQVDEVVQHCEASYNTQISVISALAAAALRHGKVHGILLMVEMGDGREGILPQDLCDMARHVADMPGVALKGIGANFACLSGMAPTDAQMLYLSDLANDVERQCGLFLQTVSGGNSANLAWAFDAHRPGRINDLRLGEAILLGVDPVTGAPIGGLFQDAFTLVAEVIETKANSMQPRICVADSALSRLQLVPKASDTTRIILATGNQDTDASELTMPQGSRFVGATSDHLVLSTTDVALRVGSLMRFQMTYGALMRAMAAPDVQTNLCKTRPAPPAQAAQGPGTDLALV